MKFGLTVEGSVDIRKAVAYIYTDHGKLFVGMRTPHILEPRASSCVGRGDFCQQNEVSVNGKMYKCTRERKL